MEDLLGAQAGAVFEARLDHECEVSVAALQAGDHVAAAERDGQQVGGDACRALRGREAFGVRGAELEDADEPVPEHHRREDDAGEAARREEPRRSGAVQPDVPAGSGGHGEATGHGRGRWCVLVHAPRAAVVGRIPSGVPGGEGLGDAVVHAIQGAGGDLRVRSQRLQGRKRKGLGVHRRRADAEPGDEVVELRDAAGKHPGVVLASQREGRRGRGGLDERELVSIEAPLRGVAVDLEQSDHPVTEMDGRRVNAVCSPLVAPDQMRPGRLPGGEIVDRHRRSGDERRRGLAEVGRRVQKASQRGRPFCGGYGHRLEGVGVLVVAQYVAGHGAQLVAQPFCEGSQELFGPQGALAWSRARVVRKARLLLSLRVLLARDEPRGLAGHELGERHVRAAEGPRRARLDEFHDGAVAAIGRQRHRQNRDVAALSVDLGVGALEEVGRGKIGDHQPAARAEHLSHRRKRLAGPGHLVGGASAGPALCTEDAESATTCGDRDPAVGHAYALRRDTGEGQEGSAQVFRGEGPCREVRPTGGDTRRYAAPTLRAHEGFHVGAPVAAMTAGAAIAGQPAGVAPPPERVEAHAELRRRLAEAEPVLSVRTSYAHGGKGAGVSGRSEVP